MMGDRVPARHDLLHLTDAGWAAVATRDPGPGIRHWAAHGLPAMRRRAQPGDLVALVPAAVAFPAALGTARLAFQVRPSDIAAIAPPPTLRAAMPDLPARFRERARAVLALAAEAGLRPRVFGSAMWQHVTGLRYLHEGSDLDLLWDMSQVPSPAPVIARLVASLQALEAGSGPRLDSEIVLGRTRAANWRELAPGARDEVLVKTADAVMLMSRSGFLLPC